MKKIIRIIFYVLVIVLIGCSQNKDSEYFNGKIKIFDDTLLLVKNIASKSVPIDDYNYGYIAVYDSLAILWNPQLSDHFFKIYNIDTGKEIGVFCNKGRGPQEAISLPPIFQIFEKNDKLITLLYAINEGKAFLWDINESIKKKETVFYSIINRVYRNKDKSPRFDNLFYQSIDSTLVARVSSVYLSEDAQYYEKRTMDTNDLIADYHVFKKSIEYNDIKKTNYYYTTDVIKPDGSKIAQAMMYLPQINIIDTQTGNIVGYRIPNSPDFSLFDTNMVDCNIYYNSIQVDDNFIYATYWGKRQWNAELGAKLPIFNIIHVYDWNGKFICKITTDRSFFRIWLDQIRNRLYTTDLETQQISYLDLNEL